MSVAEPAEEDEEAEEEESESEFSSQILTTE